MKSIWLAGAILLFVKNVVIFQVKNYLKKEQKSFCMNTKMVQKPVLLVI